MPPVNNVDLPGIFQAAANFRLQQERIKDARDQRRLRGIAEEQQAAQLQQQQEQQAQRQSALAQLAQGDPSQLAAIDPALANKLRGQELDQQFKQQQITGAELGNAEKSSNLELKQFENTRRKGLVEAQTIKRGVDRAIQNPDQYAEIAASLKRNGVPEDQIPAENPGPEALQQVSDALSTQIEVFGNPQFTSRAGELAQSLGLNPEDPSTLQNEDFRKGLGELAAPKKAPVTNINTTIQNRGREATGAVKTELQKEVKENQNLLRQLNSLDKLGDPAQFLTFGGKAKAKGISFLEKVDSGLISSDDKEFLSKSNKFIGTTKKVAAGIRRQFLGAAQSVQELESFAGAIVDADLSPTEFATTNNRMKQQLRVVIEANKRILAKGFELGTDEGDAALDAEVANIRDAQGGGGSAQPADDAKLVGRTTRDLFAEAVRDRGMDPEEAQRRLQEFIDQGNDVDAPIRGNP